MASNCNARQKRNGDRRQSLFLVLMVVLLMACTLFTGTVAAPMQNYIDDETGEVGSFDPSKQFDVEVINLSAYRVDVHYDDGQMGMVIGTFEVGEQSKFNTYQGHEFFVTRHGVREQLYPKELVEGEKDTPLRLTVQKPKQKLIIPEGAAPLSGERAKNSRCVDRYSMCTSEGELVSHSVISQSSIINQSIQKPRLKSFQSSGRFFLYLPFRF